MNEDNFLEWKREIEEATKMTLGEYTLYRAWGCGKEKSETQKSKVKIKREKILNEKIEKKKKELEEAGVKGEEVSKEVYKIIQEERNKPDEYYKYKKIKDLLREGLGDKNISDVLAINSIIPQNQIKMPQKIKNHVQFLEYIRKHDLRFYFRPLDTWHIDKFYDCVLVEGNFAWIAIDEGGSYRYFSKERNGATIGLDWIDLIMIIENIDIAIARMKLSQDLNLSYKERKWEIKMQTKYVNNIKKIERAYDNWEERYPKLYQFSMNYLYILLKLNAWGLAHLITEEESVKGESIFFVSTTHLSEFLQTDQAIISKAINMFAVLGLIDKVNIEEVPTHLFQIAQEIRGDRVERMYVNFYTLPELNHKVLQKAERTVNKLGKNGITNMQKINKKKIAEIFGQEFRDSIYSERPALTDNEKTLFIEQRQKQEQNDFLDMPF